MRLFIAEKPSMATEISKCLGEATRHEGYFQVGDDLVTWLYGHVLEMFEPIDYDKKYGSWRNDDLPIVPQVWKLKVLKKHQRHFGIVKNLINKVDVIVHAGDPDREGQLLVDEVLDYLGNTKPVKRILLNALDEKSIKNSMEDLRDNNNFRALKVSAEVRQRLDWLVGMNLSRAVTLATKKRGYDKFSIGRVKTPIVGLVVRREQEILNFKPQKYFSIIGLFKVKGNLVKMQWKAKENQTGVDSNGHLSDVIAMRDILVRLNEGNHIGNIKDYTTSLEVEKHRKLYSLSLLQVEAGKVWGYEPQLVLDTMQQLYEKKLTTYPRSDCSFLPTTQLEAASTIIHNLKLTGDVQLYNYANMTNLEIKSNNWNDEKITAHHAIIPTQVACDINSLSEIENKLYCMISKAYIAQFLPEHRCYQTKIEVSCVDEIFTATGKVILEEGWKKLYKNTKQADDEITLPEVIVGEEVILSIANSEEKVTSPPKRFSPSGLIAAMKEIHKYVYDKSLKDTLKSVTGIGTEATRASIIDELLSKGVLKKDKKNVIPSQSAVSLIEMLPNELTYADTTAILEDKLAQILSNEIAGHQVISEQVTEIKRLCDLIQNLEIKYSPGAILCPEPKCDGVLQKINGKNGAFWNCTNYPSCTKNCSDNNGVPNLEAKEYACPICNEGKLHLRTQKQNKKSKFWSCSNWQSGCKAIFDNYDNEPLIIECPSCKKGFLKKKKGKDNDFWGCTEWQAGCKAYYKDKAGKPQI